MYSLVIWIEGDMQSRYLSLTEISVFNISSVLSSILSKQIEEKISSDTGINFRTEINDKNFVDSFRKLKKINAYMNIYITDTQGIVIYDSANKNNIGKDFSRWKDVYLTLRGKYGARTTVIKNQETNAMYMFVASPVIVNQKILGVLTVRQPNRSVKNLLLAAKKNIYASSIIAGICILVLGIIITLWITLPIKKLIRYANAVKDGKRENLPKLGNSEIRHLGLAFEQMKETIEGKKYIENYVQTLTHEMKSPFAAISGAAELLQEDMPLEKRKQFLNNIQSETKRIHEMISKLLELSSLEMRKELNKSEKIDLAKIIEDVCKSLEPDFITQKIKLSKNFPENYFTRGEQFLIRQAIENLIRNSIEFCDKNGEIKISFNKLNNFIHIVIIDNGAGIPDYALPKIYDRFFSLTRPNTGKKSSGLGLTFVKEIAVLHKGSISLQNREIQGVEAVLALPEF